MNRAQMKPHWRKRISPQRGDGELKTRISLPDTNIDKNVRYCVEMENMMKLIPVPFDSKLMEAIRKLRIIFEHREESRATRLPQAEEIDGANQ